MRSLCPRQCGSGGAGTGKIDDKLGGGTAPPPSTSTARVPRSHLDDDLFDQSPQQLLAVLVVGVGRTVPGPHRARGADGCYFLWPEHLWASGLTPDELGFGVTKSKERPLPLGLEPSSNEAVVRVDGEIAPFGSARLETVPFDLFAPLRQGGVAVVLERLCRNERGLDARRGDSREERV